MKLSIIIPVFQNWKYTKACLDYFLKYNQTDLFELIIINNGSTDETDVKIQQYKLDMINLVYIKNDNNLGFAKGVNQGFNASCGENILFLNNDILFAASNINWISDLIKQIADDYLIGPIGGFIDKNFNFKYETNESNKEINYMSGWFLCATRKTFDKLTLPNCLGPFDDKTFFSYFEDTDLSWRAKEKNIKFKLINVPIHHLGRQTSKLINTSQLYLDSKQKFVNKWTKK